jgi:hypothetical protein
LRRYSSLQFTEEWGMNSKILNGLIAGALGATLALASPALAFRGGGGGMGGGMHAGGMGGGMHVGGMGGGMHVGAMSGGMHFGGMGGGTRFSGGHFAGAHFARPGFSPRFSRLAFRDGFHHRFHRFAFVGAPLVYASYNSCLRKVWTPYGWRWVDVCSDYGY